MLLKAILFVSSVLSVTVTATRASLGANICGGELFDDRCEKVSCDLKLFGCTKNEPAGAQWDGCYFCNVGMKQVLKDARAKLHEGGKHTLPEGCTGHHVGKSARLLLKDTKAHTMVFFARKEKWDEYKKVPKSKHAPLGKRDIGSTEVALQRRDIGSNEVTLERRIGIITDLVQAACYVLFAPVGIVLGLLTILVALVLTILASPFILLGIV